MQGRVPAVFVATEPDDWDRIPSFSWPEPAHKHSNMKQVCGFAETIYSGGRVVCLQARVHPVRYNALSWWNECTLRRFDVALER